MVKLLLISALIICNSSLFAGNYSGGSGTSGSPYQIETLADLIELSTTSADWASGKYFIQTADIDATTTSTMNSGAGFSPIGNVSIWFSGNYDGQNHTISYLYINRNTTEFVGLFGFTFGSAISNLGLQSINIIGKHYVGGLAGYINDSNISDCYFTGTISGNQHVGGLAGVNNNSTINNCYITAIISGDMFIGGLVGTNFNFSSINNSYTTGSISGLQGMGGFVGYNIDNASINNCYSTANVICTSGSFDNVGGFCACSYDNSTISNCYSVGNVVNGGATDNGFIGFNDATATNNYFNSETSGQTSGIGATPLTTAEMKTQSTFTTNLSDWDFGNDENDWVMSSNISFSGYPTFRWTEAYAVEPTGSPLEISSVQNLVWLAENSSRWTDSYIQTADINMRTVQSWDGNKGFSPIGSFSGSYDGQNHTISYLYINRNTTGCVGLFGFTSGCTISNLGLKSININGRDYVGGLVGYNYNSNISNCYSTGKVSGTDYVGGFCGWNYDSSTISNCYSTGNVSGTDYVGGFCGHNYDNSTISNCYSTGNVSGTDYIGGFCGWNRYSSTISNCYSTGNVSGTNYVGGFCGLNFDSSIINNCYSTGNVARSSGTNTNFGGFCGRNYYNSTINYSYCIGSVSCGGSTEKGFIGSNGATATNNYFNSEASGQESGYGASPLTTTEMKIQNNFTGWDFITPIWNIQSGSFISYPYLQGISYDPLWARIAVNPIPGLVNYTPTAQASNLQFSNITRTSMTISWTRGTGSSCLLLGREQFKILSSPLTDGIPYTSNSSSYNDVTNSTVGGAKVLYNGSGSSVSISELTKYKLYYFRVFEYTSNIGNEKYLQTTTTNNPRSRWTLRRDGMAEEDLSIDSEYPYPNPVSNSINTKLDVFEAGNITAYLFDNSGRQIAELYNQYHDFGTYDLQFDLSQIAQGAYQLVINKGSEAVVYPISVIR